MASVQSSLPAFCGLRRCSGALSPQSFPSLPTLRRTGERKSNLTNLKHMIKDGIICRAMVQQTLQGAPAAYAKEMERLSAKESLLLATGNYSCLMASPTLLIQLKDAGGFEAVVTGKVTEIQRVDVMERITGLERLNPTPRPTTRLPTMLANLLKMDVLVKDGYAKITAYLRLLNSTCLLQTREHPSLLPDPLLKPFHGYLCYESSFQASTTNLQVESKVILSTKLTVEGPQRMKEEYIEGLLESPSIVEEAVPEQLKGALGQAAGAVQQLPAPIKDVVSSGIRVPLSGTFQRMFMISYLDDEILVYLDDIQ
ncbi:hypothetical protein Cgig2_012168 [Carnegiea gigantea]|uniref:Plastid lipid-associated protein/fibrillin conserved domain-containing protein n=1 Tax=Carnegiea gigantea TaxID=171969 RepID=A0A9Q1KTC2_9CARY|nr:hypothetical protein Cgig2_012168 [Carnegiea gigantea]